MPDRPFVDFKQCKSSIELPEVLKRFGIADQFTRRGECWSGPCPLPGHPVNRAGGERNRSQFKINKKDGVWLWRCFATDHDIGGDVVRFVQEMLQCEIAHVRYWFAREFPDIVSTARRGQREKRTKKAGDPNPGLAGMPGSPTSTDSTVSGALTDGKSLEPLSFSLRLNLQAALPYLESRGISEVIANKYGLGICERGVLKGYLSIPVYRWPAEVKDERPSGYVGRWPGSDFDESSGRPRYKVPDGFQTSRCFFGIRQALSCDCLTSLILVEGPLKAIWLADRGFSNVISTFTASLSDEQAEILASLDLPVVFCFDSNESGLAGMRKAAAKLIARRWCRVVRLPHGAEPDELDDDALEKHLGFARP